MREQDKEIIRRIKIRMFYEPLSYLMFILNIFIIFNNFLLGLGLFILLSFCVSIIFNDKEIIYDTNSKDYKKNIKTIKKIKSFVDYFNMDIFIYKVSEELSRTSYNKLLINKASFFDMSLKKERNIITLPLGNSKYLIFTPTSVILVEGFFKKSFTAINYKDIDVKFSQVKLYENVCLPRATKSNIINQSIEYVKIKTPDDKICKTALEVYTVIYTKLTVKLKEETVKLLSTKKINNES